MHQAALCLGLVKLRAARGALHLIRRRRCTQLHMQTASQWQASSASCKREMPGRMRLQEPGHQGLVLEVLQPDLAPYKRPNGDKSGSRAQGAPVTGVKRMR